MKIPFVIAIFLFCVNTAFTQKVSCNLNLTKRITLEKQLDSAIGENWHLKDFVIGDINNDKLNDVIVIGSASQDEEESRMIYLYINKGKNLFVLYAKNQHIIQCEKCGGAGVGDPYQNTNIKSNCFSFETFYGACDKTNITVTFKFDVKRKWWFLHKDVTENYSCKDEGIHGIKIKSIEDKKGYGKVRFEDYQ